MRRLGLLINDVRFNSNNETTNRFSDLRLHKFFNDAQRTIQSLIHTHDTNGKYFVRESIIDAINGQESYPLPDDLFTDNSINSIARAVTVDAVNYYTPLRQLTEKERRKEFGYMLQGGSFLMSPIPSNLLSNGIRINYTYRVPTLSVRIGKISVITPGVSLKFVAGTFSSETITNFEDYFCVIGADGTIKDKGLILDSYNTSSGKINSTSTIVNGAVGDYVAIGKESTTHSELPDVCEQILTNFVERKIQAVDSSKEIQDIDLLSSDEKKSIEELFVQVENDTKYPPITDDTYLNF